MKRAANPYQYPEGEYHVYRHCVVCEKPFRVFRCHLNDRASMFCTQRCHRMSRSLFRRMLADGRLEPLLKATLAEMQKEEAANRQVVRDGSRAYTS
jgi:hypothetical protein